MISSSDDILGRPTMGTAYHTQSAIRAHYQAWWPLIPILALALILRIGYLPVVGHMSDMQWNGRAASLVYRVGLLNLYAARTTDYPPIYMSMMGVVAAIQNWRGLPIPAPTPTSTFADTTLVVLMKIFPVAGDIGLIIAVYAWLRHRRFLRWVIPVALALLPASIMDAAWWGQSDMLLVVLVALALIAMNQRKPLYAWAFFAIAMLTKFQGIVVLPVLLVLTFRRHGARSTILGIAVVGLIMGLVLAPFILSSGLSRALYPYTGATDEYPWATVNAFNLWYIVTPHQPGIVLPFPDDRIKDTSLIGPFTYKQIGFSLLALYTLLIMLGVWKQADQDREFVWAAAMYFGFFMFPTQIHERYLFPAGVFLIIALAQDRRLWLVALLANYALAYNLIQAMNDHNWLGYFLWSRDVVMLVAWLTLAILVEVVYLTITLPRQTKSTTARRFAIQSPVVILSRVAAALLIAAIGWILITEDLTFYPTARWLLDHVADHSQLVSENLNIVYFTHESRDALSWTWQLTPVVETKAVGAWLGEGSHYAVLDEKTSPENFDRRVQKLIDQGATLLYQSSPIPGVSWRQAVLWTFHPQVRLNLTFDDSLTLVGYDVLGQPDSATSLRWYWYTRRPPAQPYHLFVHIVDPATEAVIGQADAPLGGGTHPSDTWRRNEIVFEMTNLPTDMVRRVGCEIPTLIGLYQLDDGQRAVITDQRGAAIGDHVALRIKLPPESCLTVSIP